MPTLFVYEDVLRLALSQDVFISVSADTWPVLQLAMAYAVNLGFWEYEISEEDALDALVSRAQEEIENFIEGGVLEISHVSNITDGQGGGASVGWNDFPLNTIQNSQPGIDWIALGVDSFTLQPGRYWLRGSVPCFRVGTFVAAVRDDSDVLWAHGTLERSETTDTTQSRSFVFGVLDPVVATTFKLSANCEISKPNNGLGVAHAGALTGRHAECQILRLGDVG